MDGKGNSNHVVNYQFVDNKILNSIQYSYLLIQHDLDGAKNTLASYSIETYSKDILVGEITPNPLVNKGTLLVQSSIFSNYQLQVTNIIGVIVYSINGEIHPGVNNIGLHFNSINSGLYFLTIQINQNKFTRNIIIN